MTSNDERRAIKREYRDTYRPAGVFQVRNLVNGKVLLGSSPNLPAMFNRLRMQLSTGTYAMHPDLQADWRAEGADRFAFEILEELEPPETPGWDPRKDLEVLLELWLERVEPFADKGYNRPPKP